MDGNEFGSRSASRAAIAVCISSSREAEKALKDTYLAAGIHVAAADYGGEFSASVQKIIERAVVCARREKLIGEDMRSEGAVAGAAHEALSQVTAKALGLNVGGKIGIARIEEHIAVAVFFGIGMMQLNEVAVGLGHRVL